MLNLSKSGCTHCEPCQPGTEADRMGALNCTLCNQGITISSLRLCCRKTMFVFSEQKIAVFWSFSNNSNFIENDIKVCLFCLFVCWSSNFTLFTVVDGLCLIFLFVYWRNTGGWSGCVVDVMNFRSKWLALNFLAPRVHYDLIILNRDKKWETIVRLKSFDLISIIFIYNNWFQNNWSHNNSLMFKNAPNYMHAQFW